MKKNRILGFGIAIALTITSCLPVLAADPAPTTVNGTKETNENANVAVTYEAAVGYTVTIPAEATLSKDSESTITISLGADTMMEKGGYLAATTDGEVSVTANGATLKSVVTPPTGDGNRLTGTNTSCDFKLATIKDVDYAGKYTGTLTFNLSYVGPTAP